MEMSYLRGLSVIFVLARNQRSVAIFGNVFELLFKFG
jgi:hypothetical protein